MNLIYKIKAVQQVFNQLEKHTNLFTNISGLKCLPNCSHCCTNQNINAAVLEFLPAAYDLFVTNGYESVFEKLEQKTDSVCIFYNPFIEKGNCSNYHNRGLICRLFGFAGKIDKNGIKVHVPCKPLKPVITPLTNESLCSMPDMQAYQMSLYGIDPKLSQEFLPINEAIKKALEIVLFHFQFRKKRA